MFSKYKTFNLLRIVVIERIILLIVFIFLFLHSSMATAEKNLRIGVVSLPQDFGNPYGSITIPTLIGALSVFDSLTFINSDGILKPWIAKEWFAKDRLTWHFKLRKDIKFSNGQQLNAKAVANALNYFASGEGLIEVVAQSVIDIKSARAMDEFVLEIKTHRPNILLPRRLSGIRIPEPKVWNELGRNGFSRKPIGSGPFIATSWNNTKIKLKANKESWRPPKIDNIEIIAIPEITSRLQALITGAIDIAIDISPEDGSILNKANADLNFRPSGRVQLLALMSIGNSPVSDVRVRQALNYAVNKERIIKVLLANATQPTGQAAVKGSFGYNPEVQPYPYNPQKAKQLLNEAGYPEGFEMTAEVIQGAMAGDGAWYLQIANDLSDVGIKVIYQASPYTQHLRKIRQGGWKGLAFGMDFNNLPSLDVLWPLRIHSCLWNAPWHCRPEWTPLIQNAEKEFNLEKRLAMTQKLVKMYNEYPTSIYLWEVPGVDGISNNVINYNAHHAFIHMNEIEMIE